MTETHSGGSKSGILAGIGKGFGRRNLKPLGNLPADQGMLELAMEFLQVMLNYAVEDARR